MLIFTDNIVAVFDDMRNFGRFFLSTSYSNLVKEVPSLKSIGIDGLNFSFIDFLSIVRLKRNQNKPLGELLLDQRFVAGVGNIYKSESLWRAKISPFTTIKELSEEELAVLGKNICEVLEQAFAHGGSTIKNFRSVDGEGEAQKWHAVYSREDQPCLRCQKPIARTIQKNRSTFFCPNCQRPKISTIVPTEYTLNAKT
jgi:formamidopyrimidine-DNA glycosylase